MALTEEQLLDRANKDLKDLAVAHRLRRKLDEDEKLNPVELKRLREAELIKEDPERVRNVKARAKALIRLKRIRDAKANTPSPITTSPPEAEVTPPVESQPSRPETFEKEDEPGPKKDTPQVGIEPAITTPPKTEQEMKPQLEEKPPILQPGAPVKKKVKTPKTVEGLKKINLGEKVNKPPAFQYYASDFEMDTASWTCTAIGIYTRLLNYEWVNRSIPDDTEQLARIARIDRGNFLKCWCPFVKGKFSQDANGNLVNKRMEQVRKEQEEYRKRQSELGFKSVEARRKRGIFPFNKSNDGSNDRSNHLPNQNQTLQSSSSSSNNKEHYIEGSKPFRFATLLLEEIRKNKSDFKQPNLQTWALVFDLMFRIDKRSPETVERVIRWVQADHGDGTGRWKGWAANVLSPGKLRQKFDELELKMLGDQRKKSSW